MLRPSSSFAGTGDSEINDLFDEDIQFVDVETVDEISLEHMEIQDILEPSSGSNFLFRSPQMKLPRHDDVLRIALKDSIGPTMGPPIADPGPPVYESPEISSESRTLLHPKSSGRYFKANFIRDFPNILEDILKEISESELFDANFCQPNGKKLILISRSLLDAKDGDFEKWQTLCNNLLVTFGFDFWEIITWSNRQKSFSAKQDRAFSRFSHYWTDVRAMLAIREHIVEFIFITDPFMVDLFVPVLLRRFFSRCFQVKLRSVIPDSNIVDQVGETDDDTVAYVAGYCYLSVRRGCLRFTGNSLWEEARKVLNVCSVMKVEESNLDASCFGWLTQLQRGGLSVPTALGFQLINCLKAYCQHQSLSGIKFGADAATPEIREILSQITRKSDASELAVAKVFSVVKDTFCRILARAKADRILDSLERDKENARIGEEARPLRKYLRDEIPAYGSNR